MRLRAPIFITWACICLATSFGSTTGPVDGEMRAVGAAHEQETAVELHHLLVHGAAVLAELPPQAAAQRLET